MLARELGRVMSAVRIVEPSYLSNVRVGFGAVVRTYVCALAIIGTGRTTSRAFKLCVYVCVEVEESKREIKSPQICAREKKRRAVPLRYPPWPSSRPDTRGLGCRPTRQTQ